MTHQDILTKAIEKAIAGGWNEMGKPEQGWGVDYGQWSVYEQHLMINHFKRGDEYYHINQIIYSHKFAKALWGDIKYPQDVVFEDGASGMRWLPNWQRHLQIMVIADNPIEYLGENI